MSIALTRRASTRFYLPSLVKYHVIICVPDKTICFKPKHTWLGQATLALVQTNSSQSIMHVIVSTLHLTCSHRTYTRKGSTARQSGPCPFAPWSWLEMRSHMFASEYARAPNRLSRRKTNLPLTSDNGTSDTTSIFGMMRDNVLALYSKDISQSFVDSVSESRVLVVQ